MNKYLLLALSLVSATVFSMQNQDARPGVTVKTYINGQLVSTKQPKALTQRQSPVEKPKASTKPFNMFVAFAGIENAAASRKAKGNMKVTANNVVKRLSPVKFN